MNDCTRGCTLHGQHNTTCTCTPECGQHDNHCAGCTPRRADVGHYCQKCADTLRGALTQIPTLTLYAATLPEGRLMSQKVAGDTMRRATKVDQMSPSPAWDTADEMVWWAHTWALTIADSLNEAGPFKYRTTGVPRPMLSPSINFILARFTQVLSNEDYCDDLYTETLHLRKNLTRLTGRDAAQDRIKEPCPSCDRRTLIRENGSDKVECRNVDCARVWFEDEYARLAHEAAS